MVYNRVLATIYTAFIIMFMLVVNVVLWRHYVDTRNAFLKHLRQDLEDVVHVDTSVS